jgi:hypothetical protein
MAIQDVSLVSANRFYNRWKTLNKMFTNPNSKHYEDYGAKGVTFSEEWSSTNPEGSRNFVNWMEEQFAKNPELDPHNSAVIRKDFEGNFGPETCVVANRKDVRMLSVLKHK